MLGEKLREGSEKPYARAMLGLCNYAIDDEAEGLDAALADLRVADAKHRLAYILTQAALIDCERGRIGQAGDRAVEALEYATLLERPTEMLLARALLAHAGVDHAGCRTADHVREVERLAAAGAATWTAALVDKLVQGRGRPAARRRTR